MYRFTFIPPITHFKLLCLYCNRFSRDLKSWAVARVANSFSPHQSPNFAGAVELEEICLRATRRLSIAFDCFACMPSDVHADPTEEYKSSRDCPRSRNFLLRSLA